MHIDYDNMQYHRLNWHMRFVFAMCVPQCYTLPTIVHCKIWVGYRTLHPSERGTALTQRL